MARIGRCPGVERLNLQNADINLVKETFQVMETCSLNRVGTLMGSSVPEFVSLWCN